MPQRDELPDSRCEAPDAIVLNPVGIVRNNIKEPFLAAVGDGIKVQGPMDAMRAKIREMRLEASEIIIEANLLDILDGVEKYSHLVVLYWAHKVPEQSRLLTRVHPMGREEFPRVGIFGTCSPARPNPVLMSVVRLCARRKNVLEVTGLDAVNGSPVIDIKPYVKDFYPQEDVLVPEWMQRILEEFNRGDE